jgi:hypothetical protein
MSKLLNSKYLVINENTSHTVEYLSLKDAKQLIDGNKFIFKMPTTMYHNPMFKYPLSKYYSCLEINQYKDDVWVSLNVINKQEKDFTEYIEIVYKEPCYNIKYKTI